MTHPSEEQLALYCCGEHTGRAAIEEHLTGCAACRAEVAAVARALQAVDAMPVPERGPGYGREVWAWLQPRLEGRAGLDWRAWFGFRRLALAGAMAALALIAFVAGRFWPRPEAPLAGATSPEVRERILLVAVGDHLERSQMVLVELVNTRPNGGANITAEQQRAEELVSANRLYRQTAAQGGDTAVANVLDDLERVLIEIARSPAQMSSAHLAALQRRIESKGILFKVRVVGSQVREKAAAPATVKTKL